MKRVLKKKFLILKINDFLPMLRKIVKPEESAEHYIPLEVLIQETGIIYYTVVHFVDT